MPPPSVGYTQWHNENESPEQTGGPDVRMTAAGAEDLYRMITHARPDWSTTAVWAAVSALKRDRRDRAYTEIVIAVMHCCHNPLIASPEAICEDGRHWDNVLGYLTTGQQGTRYRDAHSANVLEQARADQRHIAPGVSGRPSAGYLAATAARLAAKRSA